MQRRTRLKYEDDRNATDVLQVPWRITKRGVVDVLGKRYRVNQWVVGVLKVQSGRFAASSAIPDDELPVFERPVPTGDFQVTAISNGDGDLGLIKVEFGWGEPTEWEAAGRTSKYPVWRHFIPIDHAAAVILDASDCDAYRSYVKDALAAGRQIAVEMTYRNPVVWYEFAPGRRAIVFSTANTNGRYGSFFGLTAQGELLCWVMSFWPVSGHPMESWQRPSPVGSVPLVANAAQRSWWDFCPHLQSKAPGAIITRRENNVRNLRSADPSFFGIRSAAREVPAELVGCWAQSTGNRYQFTAAGQYLAMSCLRWSLSPDGQALTLHTPGENLVFRSRFGNGTTLVGVWYRGVVDVGPEGTRETEEEMYFRADGTHAWHWSDDLDTYYGVYGVTGDQVTLRELRAVFDCAGTTITFFSPSGGKYPGTYAVDGDRLTITFPGGVQTFDRVSCT